MLTEKEFIKIATYIFSINMDTGAIYVHKDKSLWFYVEKCVNKWFFFKLQQCKVFHIVHY